jgi:cold shock CspA family protein
MAWGTIKNLTTDRGFGYILPEGPAKSRIDLLFNRKDVKGVTPFEELRAGQRVEYDLATDERRGTSFAKNIRGTPRTEAAGAG